jgi:hypothetical protein
LLPHSGHPGSSLEPITSISWTLPQSRQRKSNKGMVFLLIAYR